MTAITRRRVPLQRRFAAVAAVCLAPLLPAIAAETEALTLEDCFRLAKSASQRVLGAHEQVEQARLQRRLAISASLPQLTLEDNYYRQNQVELPAGGGSAVSTSDRRNQLLLRLRQPIFSGFRDFATRTVTAESIRAAELGLEAEHRLLYAAVARTFFAILQEEEQVKVLESAVALERERLREMRARNEVGLARKTEALLQESRAAENEARLIAVRSDLGVQRLDLGFLLGRSAEGPLRDDVVVAAPLDETPPPGALALALRSDYQRLSHELAAAEAQVKVARGEWLPTLGLDIQRILKRSNYSLFGEETTWTAQLDLVIPVFDGGRASADVGLARSRERQKETERDDLARRIGVEVASTHLGLRASLAARDKLAQVVASAEENDHLVQEEYRSGLAANIEVITANDLLLANRLALERQHYQIKLDWILYQLALGLLPAPGGADQPAPTLAPSSTSIEPLRTR